MMIINPFKFYKEIILAGSLVAGILIISTSSVVLKFLVIQLTKLHPDWPGFDIWVDIPVTVTIPIYIYNVTNSKDFLNHGCKPILQEVGPYIYKMGMHKTNVVWDELAGTVDFDLVRNYKFASELSERADDEYVIVPNLAMFAAVAIGKRKTKIEQFAVSWMTHMYERDIFVKRTVKDLLFSGYYSQMTDILQTLSGEVFIPGGIIGLLKLFNGTDRGRFSVNSGRLDRGSVGQIQKWNGSSNFNYWRSLSCDKVRGTDGNMFHPFLSKDETLELYTSELCRPVKLVYEKETSHRGITSYRYKAPFSESASVTVRPENECYCLQTNKSKCLGSGMLDISPCNFGAPLVISFPHFYRAEKSHLQRIKGISPRGEVHNFYFDVEPSSGATLSCEVAVQANVDMTDLKGTGALSDIPSMIFPLLWMKEQCGVEDIVTDFIFLFLKLPQILSYVIGGLMILFTIGGIAFLHIRAKRRLRKKKEEARRHLHKIISTGSRATTATT